MLLSKLFMMVKAPPKKECIDKQNLWSIGKPGGVSDVVVDGLVPGVNFDVIQGVASFAHLNDNAFITVRRKRERLQLQLLPFWQFRIAHQHFIFYVIFNFISIIKYLTSVYTILNSLLNICVTLNFKFSYFHVTMRHLEVKTDRSVNKLQMWI